MAREEEPEGERPWNEEQWEEFMKKSDARSAKFGELLETFMDHPDRDAIIDREMGWDQPVEREPGFDPEAILEEAAEIDEDEWQEIQREEEAGLEAIPAYTRGFAFADRLFKTLRDNKLFLTDEAEDKEPDEDVVEAISNSRIVAAKIAGGHGMGYEDDVLCGNIVNCKRSLAAADECVAALERMRERKLLPADKLDKLIDESKEIRGLVEQHIAELRSRVWWQ
jgi:hypothetical protein